MDLRPILRFQIVPKGDQHGAEHGPKPNQKSKMKHATLWNRLCVGCGSFGCKCPCQTSTESVVDIKFSEQSCYLTRYSLEIHFGLILDRFWFPNASRMESIQNGCKAGPNIDQNNDDILIDFVSSQTLAPPREMQTPGGDPQSFMRLKSI